MMEKEPPEPEKPLGTVVIGTLEPDMHETPKEMVRKALKRAGFKTVDLGKAASPQNFAAKAKEVNADIIAVSINTKPAKDNIPKLNQAIVDAGLKEKVILMIGGAAVTKEDADAIGAFYGKSKEEAVAIAQKAIGERKK
ncbi:MAG: cobalamin-dependent protein [Nitrososphaerota archaeon]|nr:cobalamin-dependent protein [Candidatus Bathyarchaeota archaeon]MDW8194457.1 cobalamin-dependent protein [Nitrososphaerota archaeon]